MWNSICRLSQVLRLCPNYKGGWGTKEQVSYGDVRDTFVNFHLKMWVLRHSLLSLCLLVVCYHVAIQTEA